MLELADCVAHRPSFEALQSLRLQQGWFLLHPGCPKESLLSCRGQSIRYSVGLKPKICRHTPSSGCQLHKSTGCADSGCQEH